MQDFKVGDFVAYKHNPSFKGYIVEIIDRIPFIFWVEMSRDYTLYEERVSNKVYHSQILKHDLILIEKEQEEYPDICEWE